jgi:hypothetical protein
MNEKIFLCVQENTEQLRAGATIAAYSAPHIQCGIILLFKCIVMTIKVSKFVLSCAPFSSTFVFFGSRAE